MLGLDTLLSSVLSNPRRASSLKRFGILSVEDALTYYPFRVTDPVPQGSLRQAKVGQPIAVRARIASARAIPLHGRSGSRLEAVIEDSEFAEYGGTAQLIFFSHKRNYVTWMLSKLEAGAEVVVCGTPTLFSNALQFTHPEVLVIGTDADTAQAAFDKVTTPSPVYHASARFSSERIHECIQEVLAAIDRQGEDEASILVPNLVPNAPMSRLAAFHAIHEPESVKDFRAAIAAMRYEEAFVSQISLLQARRNSQKQEVFACPDDSASPKSLVAQMRAALPFDLTEGQDSVVAQISSDLAQSHPMQRLLQGEVGSGKTLVALLAMLQVADAGYQSVLVAPTQVLAEQHYRTIGAQCQQLKEPPAVILLTSALKLAERRRALAVVASGQPCIVIATHSAFSKTFQAPKLALAVIDEQHRFGVEQRDALTQKSELTPHLLVMTATPIPRTAAMTWFGDLEISELKGLPGGRKPVSTFVIPEADTKLMATMLWHLRKRIDAGERAYVVCAVIDSEPNNPDVDGDAGAKIRAKSDSKPSKGDEDADYVDLFIEDSAEGSEPKPPLHSVSEIAQRFASLPQFSGISIATLTGRDDEETKTRVMREFNDGTTPLLVATTVIEVGVDVATASCIVIYDADRFGLSQLHQLRGRVGRGGTQGWAFLVSRADPDSIAAARLEVIRTSIDGADIAQADLELRGVGDVLGDAQSGGKSSLKLLRVVKDADLIVQARKQAQVVLDADPELADKPQLAGAILDFIRGKEEFLTRT